MTHPTGRAQRGFTLIELSIVLVIIGLIVGGVLVGQDLIRAAEVRATITQIEKYNTAVNTFREKYGALPGDINAAAASAFGFAARGQYPGEGDGNGVIEGVTTSNPGENWGTEEVMGETAMFWVDLSQVGLIEGRFSAASSNVLPGTLPIIGTAIGSYLPAARLGKGNYVYVWSGGFFTGQGTGDGTNYYGLSAVTSMSNGNFISTPALTVQQAYSIDKKLDDGLPQTGNILAQYFTQPNVLWAAGGNNGVWPGNSASASATSCYDNSGNAANLMRYSVEISNGAGVNCALSFRFQ